MDILVAFEALLRSMREIGGADAHCGSKWARGGGFVTIDAGCALMRALERKFRGPVVEAAKLFPIPRVVTGVARPSGGMRIGMAYGATLIIEVILADCGRRSSVSMGSTAVVHLRQRFVAVGAWRGGVRVDQYELRLRVARQAERGGLEGFLRMTHFASILIRGRFEFVAMRVGVASHAGQLARLIYGFFARRLMTLFALQLEVFAFEFERAFLVHFARI